MIKHEKKLMIIISILIIIIIILLNTIYLINNNSIKNQKQIIKEMTETEYENEITQLNKSHEEYASNVQAYKKQIADAITSQGVNTSENDEGSVIATNISNILAAKTKDATATAEDIIKGKTAYVNGELIEGALEKPVTTRIYNLGKASSFDVKSLTGLDDETLSNLTEDNFIVEIISIPASSTADYSRRRKF